MTTISMQDIIVYLQRYRATSFGKNGLKYFTGYKDIEMLMTHVDKDNNWNDG